MLMRTNVDNDVSKDRSMESQTERREVPLVSRDTMIYRGVEVYHVTSREV